MRKEGHQGIIEIDIMLDLFTHDHLRIGKTSPSNLWRKFACIVVSGLFVTWSFTEKESMRLRAQGSDRSHFVNAKAAKQEHKA